jgi:class 3 adenylate cyclase
MSEPKIQYCRTSDGVSIAYAREGSGPPLVVVPNLWNNITFYQRVAPGMIQGYTDRGVELVLLDSRGTGASQRDVQDVSLETRLLDLGTVVDHLQLPPMALFAISHAGPAAIAYAVRHPERVSSLILAQTYADGAAYYAQAPVMRVFAAIEDLAKDQWEFYTRTAASAVLGYSQPELAERIGELYRDSITPEMLIRYREASLTTDVTGLLAEVRCPTLVLDDKSNPLRVEELSRALASGIRGARLVTYSGAGGPAFASDPLIAAIDDFLGLQAPAVEPVRQTTQEPRAAAMTAILFADIVDSVATTERLGDAAFRDRARALDDALRAAIRDAGGNTIEGKLLGDGVLATFPAASQAIDSALRCAAAGNDGGLPLHLGIHAGDVIREQNNVYGGAVNIASRISALSAPGEVLVSDTVRSLARTSAGVTFEDRGELVLKGVADPQRVYAVRAAEAG